MLLGANTHPYAGPNSLGPFRVDKNTSMKSLFHRLGSPPSTAEDVVCYRSANSQRFLIVTRMVAEYDRRVAGAVELSDFPNCLDKTVRTTSEDLSKWTTDKGIGLGSSERDVKKAYGTPSSEESTGSNYRWAIHGSPAQDKTRARVGTKVLGYTGASDDLRTAYFGIREGRVAWIFLSQNE